MKATIICVALSIAACSVAQTWYLNEANEFVGYKKYDIEQFNYGEVTVLGGGYYFVSLTRDFQYRRVTGSSVQNPPYWHADVASLLSIQTTSKSDTDTVYVGSGQGIAAEFFYQAIEVSQSGMYDESWISRLGFDRSEIVFDIKVRNYTEL